jgi:hypothetical protein
MAHAHHSTYATHAHTFMGPLQRRERAWTAPQADDHSADSSTDCRAVLDSYHRRTHAAVRSPGHSFPRPPTGNRLLQSPPAMQHL